MLITEFSALQVQVLWASFFLSLLFGVVTQTTHFCTMGAMSDIISMGSWTRMRQWIMAIGVAMIGFASLVYFKQIDPDAVVYASTRWAWMSALIGGLMFGFGMVLASGCGGKTLARIGAGSLKSLVVMLSMGVASFATLKGITAVLRTSSVDKIVVEMPYGTSLAQWMSALIGWEASAASLLVAILIGGGLIVWSLMGSQFLTANNLFAGVGIGGIVVCMWWVTGHLGFVAEHPVTLESVYLRTSTGKIEALSFVAPVAYAFDWVMFFSDQNKVLTTGVVSVFGMITGSWIHALGTQTFRWEGFAGTEDLANHLIGGFLMGVGGVTAMGCTIGQGLSGISTLSATSLVALLAILSGAAMALKYQFWRLSRMS